MRLRVILVVLLCAASAAPAAADWHVASTAHFVVYANDSETRVRDMAARLERFDRAVRVFRNLPDPPVSPSGRVTVYAVGNTSSIARLAGARNVAGFYIPRAAGSVAFVPQRTAGGEFDLHALPTLLHEYTHHLLLTSFADVALPAWINEGYAEFHATADMQADGSVQFGGAPNFRAWGLLMQAPMPAARLLANERARGAGAMDAFYGRSWLLVHMLSFSETRDGQLERYVTAINEGVPAGQAGADAFGDPAVLDRELSAYLRQRRISGYKVGAARLQIGEVQVRRLDEAEAAMLPARIRSTRGVDAEEAARVVEQARRAARPHANNAFAQRVLAECEYDARNFAEAAAAADRAIAADPQMMDAFTYRGMAEMAMLAARTEEVTPAEWAAARRWFLRANAVENDAAMPLILFYSSYVAAGQEPTQNARDALARAQELAPHDMDLRMQTAAMWLEAGEADRARPLLTPVAYSPHGGGRSNRAAATLAALDDPDAAVALAVLRAPPPAPGAEGATPDD